MKTMQIPQARAPRNHRSNPDRWSAPIWRTKLSLAFLIGSLLAICALSSRAASVQAAVTAPIFTPGAGTYAAAVLVAISSPTPAAAIYYTTDGSTPTTSSTAYSGPITVSASETISAIAAAPGQTDSQISSGPFTLDPSLFGTIIGVVGTGANGFSGDGGPAIRAQISGSYGLAIDSHGSIYIADFGNSRLRKVSPTGVISTISGTGVSGFSGDNGPAVNAQISQPIDVAVDASDNVFFTDAGNGRVRQIASATGIITTIAGTGTRGYNGDGVATSSELNYPSGLVVDPNGNTIIADYLNSRIRKVTPGGVISTIAGTGVSGFFGDGGPATRAQLGYSTGVAMDSAGDLYIGDNYNNRVRKVDTLGIISTVAGNGNKGYSGDTGPATKASLNGEEGVAIDSNGNLFIGSQSDVRKVDPNGIITTIAGTGTTGSSGNGGAASAALVSYVSDLSVDSTGNLYLNDRDNNQIRKITYGLATQAYAPTITPAAGTYPTAQTASATDITSGSSIHYTTDGSQPSASSPLYTGPISIASSETLNTIAIAPGYATSPVTSVTYLIGGPSSVVLQTSNNPSNFGDPVTITATVSYSSSGAPIPTGTLNFSEGTTLLARVPLAQGSASGSFTISTLSAGTHLIRVDYSGDASFAAASASTNQLVRLVPAITWAGPSAIVYGTALSSSQLNATVADPNSGVALPGSLQYLPAAGTILNAGQQMLRVNFTPTDTTAYAPATKSVSLLVTQATPTISWPTPTNIPYGSPLGAAQLNATATGISGASLPGAFVYTPPVGTVLNPGVQVLSVSFTPTDAINYLTATATVRLTVTDLTLTSFTPNTAHTQDGASAITITGSGFVPSTMVQVNGAAIATTFVNPTTLSAVIPASNLNTAAILQITLKNPATGSVSAAQPFIVLPPNPVVTFTAPSTTPPGTQPTLAFTLGSPYPLPLVLTFSLTDLSALPSGAVDPSVQFAAGGTIYSVTVPAGSTTVPVIQVQAGTIAGTITIGVTLTAGGANVTPANLAPVTIVVPAAVPAITAASISRSGTQLMVTVVGFANTREITQASFHLTPASGTTLTSTDFTAPVASAFAGWFADPASLQYGSAFRYTQIFTVSGDAGKIASVQVTLTSTLGASTPGAAQ